MSPLATGSLLLTTFIVLMAVVLLLVARLRAYRDLDFAILEHRLKLVIHDADGRNAFIEKTVTLLAKRSGLVVFDHREWSADGTVSEIRVDGMTVEPIVDAGNLIVRKTFPTPLRRNEVVTTSVSAVVKDSFLGTEEWLTLSFTRPIKHTEIEIHLPNGRPAQSAAMTIRRGADVRAAHQPEMDDDKTVIRWKGDKLTDLSAQYRLEWKWPRAKAKT